MSDASTRPVLQRREVVTAFLRAGGKILLVRRSAKTRTYQRRWAGISGSLEDPTPLQQALREIREETGLDATTVHLARAGKPLEIPAPELATCWIVHPFLFDIDAPDQIRLDWENTALRWVLPDQLPAYPMVPGLAQALAACLSGAEEPPCSVSALNEAGDTKGMLMALSAEDTRRFLSEPRNVILGTLRQDGSPQLNPMWFYWDGTVFYISTTRTRFKYRHILRDPRVTLCIDEAETLKTLLVQGRASIQEDDIWDITQRIVEKYVQPQHVAARMARFRAEPRVLIVVTPDRWVSWDRSEGANLKTG